MNKSTHILAFALLGSAFVGCNMSSHYMKDDVYGSKTPMVPVGTDMTDETNYAVYAMKRERAEDNTTYTTQGTSRMPLSRYSTVRYAYTPLSNPYFAYSWGYSPLGMYGIPGGGIGYYYGSSYFCHNSFAGYNAMYFSSPMNYGYNYGYGNYGYYGNYYSYYMPQHHKPTTTGFSSSAGTTNRMAIASPNVNYGNAPRKLGVAPRQAVGNRAVRESARGTTGVTQDRATSYRGNTAVRPVRTGDNNSNATGTYSRSSNSSNRSTSTIQRNNSSNSNGNYRNSSSGNNSGAVRSSGSSTPSRSSGGSGGGRSGGGASSGGRSPR